MGREIMTLEPKSQNEGHMRNSKKSYEQPRFTHHGNVLDLTKGANNPPGDVGATGIAGAPGCQAAGGDPVRPVGC